MTRSTVAKLGCVKLCAFFSEMPRNMQIVLCTEIELLLLFWNSARKKCCSGWSTSGGTRRDSVATIGSQIRFTNGRLHQPHLSFSRD